MGEVQLDDAPQFGTSGLRGPDWAFTDQFVADYAIVFASLFVNDGTLLVGRDLRASSPRIARAVASGAAAHGLRTIDCGVLPTPALALAAMDRGTLAIMVTGSHIPADRNGLKFFTADGEISKSDEALIASAFADRESTVQSEPVNEHGDAVAAYVSRYTNFWDENALIGLRVGVWEHSSAARVVLPDILRALGADVVTLGRWDRFVAVDTEAIGLDLRKQLASWVVEHGLDAIVSTDGDADRPLIVNGGGQVVPGDIIGPIAAQTLGANRIVTTVTANTLVERMGSFDAVERCRIGSPFVIKTMVELERESEAKTIGYEPNGGLILGFEVRRSSKRLAPLMTRDAVLPIVAILAAAQKSSLRSLVNNLPKRRTATDRLTGVPRESSVRLIDEVIAGDLRLLPDKLGQLENTDTTDGVRMTFSTGVILTLRASGNAPELRCYAEADDDFAAQTTLESLIAKLRRTLKL
ncbi:MAG: phosphomannomutase [Boseongicola sp.]